ncbi:MAG: hypothetical protein ACP5NQ_01525 [Vulcanisaeta sp.]
MVRSLKAASWDRGLGELYVMVIIIIILIVALSIIYSVLSGFSRYVFEKQEMLESIVNSRVATSLKEFNAEGNMYKAEVEVNGVVPLLNAKAVCTYDMGNIQYMQYCDYTIVNNIVYVTVPSTLINGGAGYLTITMPTDSGLTPSITLYRGPIEASVIAPSIVYFGSVNNIDAIVLLTNNSTGWVNATVIANVDGNTITNSTILPPGGSTAVLVPIGIVSIGTIHIPLTILVNNYTETISSMQINVEPPQSSIITPPLPCQNMVFGYVGNASTANLQSNTYPAGSANPYYNVAAYQGNIAGIPNPIYTYAIEEFGGQDYYVVAYYYDVSSLKIKVGNYPYVSVYLYPAQFDINATTFFFFVILNNKKGILIYWTANTNSPSPASYLVGNTVNNINNALSSMFGQKISFININGGDLFTDIWLSYVLNVNNYIGGNPSYQYVGFGIYLPNPYQGYYKIQGVAYWNYVCIGK